MSPRPRRILFGVSGGIAAYKAPDILHGWVKLGFEVETVLTEAAEQFVSPLALSTLSKRRIWRERDFLSAEYGWQIPHISLTDWADLFVIAPCTANVLRAAAQGDGSTLLGAALLANTKPLLLFPAMNSKMLASGPVRENIRILEERGAEIVDPDSGLLACGYEGKGRMPSAAVINDYVLRALCDKKDFAGMRVAVTAGPTHEYIDPVRFISNPSSGKMGYAIAEEAWRRGAEVTLITGPSALRRPAGLEVVEVVSAQDMYQACMKSAETADVIVKAAAVGDYRAAERSEQKIKRGGKDTLTLELVQNPDIAAELGRRKRPGQLLIGFAAETQNVLENAQKKMSEKNLDMIVSNDVLAPGAGFAVDTNAITIMARGAEPLRFSGTKEESAAVILDSVSALAAGR
ncbi:bifunctional phosphopantothenoylcysteine decarboxylase/phosphopantothenate--cysteine ligase CoaBC [Cloacibacillus sp. An23]|uniref:bifunctional phosphopantothenoylcysteine decarboxylase/phosphopantothenate--cysteine ligase CoaBC n=1 Tax=Cloacibacillus sp. An23 TaxID=1965591 RepID=UPI000B375A19|nr:bifunctional phosphopantothenoylcysteine decarboxylase/phosphopantothenate--cysteine ligase CoaBC [Cloacibacillus sp. An23]OUO93053.1 phosphopantothenoylcysteine decarboxylase [Cloacibacillus sp. An23]